LADNPDKVKAIVEAYFRAAYTYDHSAGGMKSLVMEDAKTTGVEALTENQAEKLVNGIEWKNTLENYAYFGLISEDKAAGYQHMEDVIANITEVLIKTGAFEDDPLDGQAHTVYYNKTLEELQAADFHPGKKLDLIDGAGPDGSDLADVRSDGPLRALSEEEWKELVPVGHMRVKPISFARGTARINVQSQRDMEELARKLNALPNYYVLVTGHARAEGDPEANQLLAEERAEAATELLLDNDVDRDRIKVESAVAKSSNGAAQSVSFKLLQSSY